MRLKTPIMVWPGGERIDLQTEDMEWPGGENGKAEASTTRKPVTPKTRAFESTTASGSLARPMGPGMKRLLLSKLHWGWNADEKRKRKKKTYRWPRRDRWCRGRF